jgi:hypothetical protein
MARKDASLVRQAAAGRWPEIFASLTGLSREVLDGNHHPCPKCGGTDRFRMIDERDGALMCNQCFATKNGDGFAAIGWLMNVDFTTALGNVRNYLGIVSTREHDPAKDLEPLPWATELVAFYISKKPGITEEAILANGGQLFRYKRKYTVIGWPIIGESLDLSNPVGWVIVDAMGSKLPKWDKSGKIAGRVSSKLTAFSKPGLLGTWAIERMKLAGMVTLAWKVEGVTDLLALWSAIPPSERERQVVVSNANGAMEKPKWRASLLARMPAVNVLQDCDEPGQIGAAAWCTEIAAADGKARNVKLPYDVAVDHGKDYRDWKTEGHDYTDLLALAAAASETVVALNADGTVDKAASSWPAQERILKLLQIDVLYENEQGAIRVFSSLLRKSSWIRDPSRLKIEHMIQACGAPAMTHITSDPTGASEFPLADVKKAISLMAASRREQSNERGIGVWRGVDDEDVLVLASDSGAARLNGHKEFTRITAPRSDGLVIDFGSGQQDWFSYDELSTLIPLAADPAWAKETIDATTLLFSRWRWKHESGPLLMAGLVMASWIQTVWSWRPLVSITGQSNSGKSMLFECLGGNLGRLGLFGRLAFRQSKSSEAGIRQGIGNTGKVIICDEFEDGKDRKRILEMFRLSTRGDQTSKGTAGGGKGQSYGLQHIAWIAAIESGLERQPDLNRFVHLELLTALKADAGKLRLPENGQLYRLGQKLLALAVYHGLAAKRVADAIKETPCEGIDSRTVEVYAVPAAMLAVALGGSEADAQGVLRAMVAGLEEESQGTTDHDELITDILSATVFLGSSLGSLTVSQIMESPAHWGANFQKVEACGVSKRDDGDLVIYCKAVKAKLLKATDWERQRIDQILLRSPGARRSHEYIAGGRPRTITLPMPKLDPGPV